MWLILILFAFSLFVIIHTGYEVGYKRGERAMQKWLEEFQKTHKE